MEAAREFNFDGLIRPTHNYAGLSYGNVASALHRHQAAYARAAATASGSTIAAVPGNVALRDSASGVV